ncbi:hypothetical protein RJ639_031912 [Escallonia herrerae]|uniref:DUF4283 domain-containing protein n=1 Tax=Escallonia herrerae TaxID=1293975 RepID=A0AA89BN53_9ASTE|nr:hypothetical protein RJ639_031912 [Escallonia herrerae]
MVVWQWGISDGAGFEAVVEGLGLGGLGSDEAEETVAEAGGTDVDTATKISGVHHVGPGLQQRQDTSLSGISSNTLRALSTTANLLPRPIGEPPPFNPNSDNLPISATTLPQRPEPAILKSSFKDTLLRHPEYEISDIVIEEEEEETPSDDELEPEDTTTRNSTIPAIHLNAITKARIRKPWNKALIIKTVDAFFSAITVTPRLQGIWRPTGKMDVPQLANGFHIIKFEVDSDYHKALEEGPWLIGTNFLSVQRWSHDFHRTPRPSPFS